MKEALNNFNANFENYPFTLTGSPIMNLVFQTSLSVVPGKTLVDKLQNGWIFLQTHVNSCYDGELDRLSTEKRNGIKQVIYLKSIHNYMFIYRK